MDKENAKQEVEKIVKRFQAISQSKLDSMPEEDIKFQFIEPLFETLGWKREEISKETRILKGRADYLMKIGNQYKLVVEAKKQVLDYQKRKENKRFLMHTTRILSLQFLQTLNKLGFITRYQI